MNLNIIIFLILSTIQIRHPEPKVKEKKLISDYVNYAKLYTGWGKTDYCIKEVLNAWGLTGRTFPGKVYLPMCPTVSYSCCSKMDQIKIYENFVQGK